MKKYLRNTHVNGVYRKEMDEIWDKIPNELSGIIHSLDPIEWLSILEIRSELFVYASQYPDENDAILALIPTLLEDILCLLVNFDMVKEIE